MNGLFNGTSVKKLLGWRIGEEEEKFAEKAVETLVKKLKKKNGGIGTLEDLEYALAHPGSHSKCVALPKSQDGRLQVSHRKGLPHVIYCRVWRWPDLQSHQELRPIPECLYPHDHNNKTPYVCINPYHYQRLDQSRNAHFSYSPPIPSPTGTTFPRRTIVAQILSSVSTAGSSPSCSARMDMASPSNIPSSSSSPEYDMAFSPSSMLSEEDVNRMDQVSPYTSPPTQYWATISYYELNSRVGEYFKVSPYTSPPTQYWATISYYELNSRVGEYFKVYKNELIVDGFTDPNSDDRICLGLLSNVNRNPTIENTRRHIGKGSLVYTSDYDLYIQNLSESSIFVQSRNLNYNMHQEQTTVCRVPAHSAAVCVFSNIVFQQVCYYSIVLLKCYSDIV
ncbi:unnamed protein product [Strongylus vulgaris]|uniref:Mothers against decapentaplegic homolog n=1 Tax=Strongylus vulgaris TaxID=40348 RepID=A0A3P7IVG1_STRVU|nr:unnamed protein product [Strongylus vulgaris]